MFLDKKKNIQVSRTFYKSGIFVEILDVRGIFSRSF